MSNLVLQYNFETANISGTTISNASYGSYTLNGTLSTTTNTISTTNFKTGTQSFYCDGNGTMFVTLPAISGLTSSFTMCCWVYAMGTSVTRRFVELQTGSQTFYCGHDAAYSLVVSLGGVTNTLPGVALVPNRWMLVSIAVTPTAITVFVNNTVIPLQNSITFGGNITTSSFIGKGSADSVFSGYIDDFRIYRGALTVDQMYELYDRGTITHYYKFSPGDLILGNSTSTATVANGYMTNPAISTNTWQSQTTLPNWTITNPSNIITHIANQSGAWGFQNPLPPNVTQWFIIQYEYTYGTVTLSQSINFDVSGGFQLTYYIACRPGWYTEGITVTSSIAGVVRNDVVVNTTTWYKFQSNIIIPTPGTYTLSLQSFQPAPVSGSNRNALYITGVTIAPFTQLYNNAFGTPVLDTLASTSAATNFKMDTSTYARGVSSLYNASNNLISPPTVRNVDASGITVSTWVNPFVTSLVNGIFNYYKLTSTSYSSSQLYNYASGTGVLDATLMNSPTFQTTQGYQELQFTASSSQYVYNTNAFNLGTNGMSFACWFRSNASGMWSRIFDFGTSMGLSGLNDAIFLAIAGNVLQYGFYGVAVNMTGDITISSLNVNDNVYRHIAFIIGEQNGSTCTVTAYINGSLVYTGNNIPYPTTVTRSSNAFGASNFTIDPFFNGGMFDVVVFKRPITQSEVTYLYSNPNNLNLLVPTFPNNAVIYSLNSGAYRWNVHARFTATNTYDLSFCMYSGANTTPLVTVSEALTPVLNSNVTVNTVASPAGSLSTSTWYHIVWCITPNYWKISINNNVSTLYRFAKLTEGTIQLVALPTTITPSLLYDPSMSSTTIGYYQGNLDEFRLYNREITDDEIYKLYTYGTLRSGYYDANGNDLITQYTAGSLGSALTYYSDAGDALSNLFSAYSETPTPNTIQFYSVVYDVSRVVISSNAIGATTTSSTSLVQVGQVMATAGVTDYPRVVSVDVPNNTVYINKSETVQTTKGQTAAAYTVVNGVLTCSAATSFTGTAPAVGDLVFHTAIPLGTYITNVSASVLTNGMSSPNVANGYFVTPVVTTGTIVEKTSALTDIVNWTFTGVSANMKVYVANNATVAGTTFTAPVLPSAQQYLVFSDTVTTGTVTLSQSLTFVLSGSYTLGFNMAGLSNINASHTLTVSIAGTTSSAYTATAHTWTTRSLNFVVNDAGTYTLSFVSTNGGGSASAMCLGAISITQPLPSETLISTLPYTLTLSNKSVNISSPTETVKWYNTSVATFSTLTKKPETESGYKLYSATGYDDYVYKFGNVLLTNLPYVATGTFTSSVSNGYYLLSFTAGSGTVTFVDVSSIQVLVVGGGGAGGGGNSTRGGGGGEGGASVFNSTYFVKNAAVYNISVGNGGSAVSNSSGECGQPSCFANMYALGGNGGTYSTTSALGGSGAGNGGDGGDGGTSTGGSNGASGVSYTVGSGSSTTYGGGGGGGVRATSSKSGGSGGGGNGGNSVGFNGNAGATNTGGGGGGGGFLAISSINGSGGAGGSGIVLIYVGALPDQPRALVVSSKSATTATVSFTPPRRPVTGYTLSAYSGALLITSVTLGASATSGMLIGLTENTAYTFTLVAYNAIGTSSTISTTATTLPLINAPTAIAVSQITNTTATIQITNTDQTPSAYYVVLTAAGYTSPTYYTTNYVVSAYGLTANTTYTVTATAVSVAQLPSAANTTTTFTTGNAPDAVIGLGVSNTDTTSTYSFTKPAQTITSYSLYRDNLTGNYTTDKLVGVYRATPGNVYSWNNSVYSGSDAVVDASVLGSPTFTTGASNYYVTLTATSSQYIALPTVDLSNNGFSVACYMKASSASATLFCFGQYDGSQNYIVRIYTNASGYLCYNMFNAAGTTSTGDVVINASNINDNTFRHFAWTLSPMSGSTCTVTGYINGTQVYQASNISYPIRGITRASCYVGKSSMAADAYWNGAVADVMIWNRTISATEVGLLSGYKSGTRPLAICPAGLQCYYLCNGVDTVISGSATLLKNQAPTQNNAILFGQPTVVTYTTYSELLLSSSKFQYAQLPALAFSGTGFSFACILRSNNSAVGTHIFEFGNGINYSAFGVTLGSGVVTYYTTDGAGTTVVSQNYTVTNLNNNTYNHFAITIGAISGTTSAVIVYWNGTVMGTNTLTYPINTPKLYGFVGANYAKTAGSLNGGIADVFVYTRPILQQEVTYLSGNVGGTVTTTSDTSQTTSVSGTITGLTKNAYYGLSVVATNGSGSSYAANAPIYTPNVPDPPTALTVGTTTTTSIQYTFTPPTPLPYWYDISTVTGSTVAYSSKIYPATSATVTVGTKVDLLTGQPQYNLGLCITAPGYYRLALFSQNTANSLYAVRIVNGVWGAPFLITVKYNVSSTSSVIVSSGLAITPDGARCIITAGTFFSNTTVDNYIYWADMRPVLNGTTSSVSFTRIVDATARLYSSVAISNDGLRLLATAYGSGGQVYLGIWTGGNYDTLSTVASGVGSYIGIAVSYDGKYIAYGKTNVAVYYSVWNGTTYSGETSIGSVSVEPRSIAFTYGAPYGIFISTYGTSNVAYTTGWNGTGYSGLSSTNTTAYGTGVNGWGATIDSSNNLYSFPYATSVISVYPITYTLTNVTSTTVTGLTSGASYNINMRSLGFYGYSQAALLTASTVLALTVTGGANYTPTANNIYSLYKFNSSGSITIYGGGNIYYVIVGGGGSTGSSNVGNIATSGGGGGGVLSGIIQQTTTTTYTIVVGSGGAAANAAYVGNAGSSSSIAYNTTTLTASGGGTNTGGTSSSVGAVNPTSGGTTKGLSGVSNVTEQGVSTSGYAGGVSASNVVGTGGYTITIGSTTYNLAGGGSGGNTSQSAGNSTFGGGNGGTTNVTTSTAGLANTGGGGGGQRSQNSTYAETNPANGGAGVVLMFFTEVLPVAEIPTITVNTLSNQYAAINAVSVNSTYFSYYTSANSTVVDNLASPIVITGLTASTPYTIYVRAGINSSTWSAYTNISLTTTAHSLVDASFAAPNFAAISSLSPSPYTNPTSTYGVYTLINGRGLSGTTSIFTDITSNFTVQFWWRTTTVSFGGTIAQRLFSRGDTTTNLYYMHSSNTYMGRNINGSVLEFGSPISANTWYHITIVSNANNWSFYVNGSSTALGARTANTNHQSKAMYFASNTTSTATIYIAELRIWNVALSTSTFGTNYNTEITTPTTNLVGLYRFKSGAMLTNSA